MILNKKLDKPALTAFVNQPLRLYQNPPEAVKYVIIKTSLDKSIFPNDCPYSLEQLLDEDWLPIQKKYNICLYFQ
ncbi:DUF29 family protein [Aphanothece sacrum]|uniref:Uncharacterized protein n=1 Tax=Aphanothece sacrum FPU1 TaxID=1920663 RepID=A0A401IGG7_APHSA|nr:DUF29 family protein [Aphanothece sacrum]GBF80373.1 hypothetical protein AsFPU1_1774 [Aphanothece sacrum FPU1]GBF84920.1 hypothetical protein AsFPU3_1975 [Aphanothece sacrum FPU3]